MCSVRSPANCYEMDSIGKECTPLKHEYDQCFNKWYSEQFLNGNWEVKNGEPCAELFAKYKACVMKTLKEKNIEIDEVLKKIIGTNDEKKPPEN
ncbi:TP53-regulated inhibitor of apoptosis 1-B-like isoform X1 [Hydractinia symbiolongicarpus]|uniref:TP53-regulated inhibitor of apoptosis 1-B-like isoform X1 n=1 Tax=Hydractinia symbiolongicarpus TaxID=13093 RepID=UPI00254C2F6B|nr:TP53-regulated inhibitor of apoptosis 1-B-like isoform X1 [Hydractinia symbiolongicarpus]